MWNSYAPVTWAEIARAVPAGSRVLRSPDVERDYLAVVSTREEFLGLRADAREVTLSVAKWLARHASWTDGTTRPTRTLICALVGAVRGWRLHLSLTAWKKARRRLEAWGLLGTVRQGSTERFRPMALARRDAPNEASVWVLCIPRKLDEKHPLTGRHDASIIMRPPTTANGHLYVCSRRPDNSQNRHQHTMYPVQVISHSTGSKDDPCPACARFRDFDWDSAPSAEADISNWPEPPY